LVVEQLCRENGVCPPDDLGILADQLDGVGLSDKTRIRHIHSSILVVVTASKVPISIDKCLVKSFIINIDACPGGKGKCITDAVQAITGCSLGRRTLKYRPYGKFAATFINLATQDAVRVSSLEQKQAERPETTTALLDAPEEDLFRVQKVRVVIPEGDLPGFPKNQTRCSRCGETILDYKEVMVEGTTLCGNCAGGSYYTEID
jgi:formylmethanofuran dehydrogenase subunit E